MYIHQGIIYKGKASVLFLYVARNLTRGCFCTKLCIFLTKYHTLQIIQGGKPSRYEKLTVIRWKLSWLNISLV